MISDLDIKHALEQDIEQLCREMAEAAAERDAATDALERAYWSTRYHGRSTEIAAVRRSLARQVQP